MTKKISELAQLTAVADDDIIPLVDVSDTTMGATGTTKYIERDDLIRAPYNAMSRQAIMNGNFDIWQRGTSFSAPAGSSITADRYKVEFTLDGGTAPTLTHSRQVLTPGDIPNGFFHYRIATNGAGTSYGNGSEYCIEQFIENGVRNLCGLNKKVTLSFYARSSIANKKLGVYLEQRYGSGGSPSSIEGINGTNWTLTSSWVKYEYTFTTNTLVGKTFGTSYDDALNCRFYLQWGSSIAPRVGDTVAESFVGSGNIDIAQVQLNSGDEALEFNPKSYEEELRACQRYYEKTFTIDVAPARNTGSSLGVLIAAASGTGEGAVALSWRFCTPKRIAPAVTTYSPDAASSNWQGTGTPASTVDWIATQGCRVRSTGGGVTDGAWYTIHASADAEI